MSYYPLDNPDQGGSALKKEKRIKGGGDSPKFVEGQAGKLICLKN